ncbi:hypothetical protein [Enterococcus sp. LJL90]
MCGEGNSYQVSSGLESYIDYERLGKDYAIDSVVVFVDDGVFIL